MRAAPPVDAALAGATAERCLIASLHALAAAVLAAWAMLLTAPDLAPLPLAAGACLAALIAAGPGHWLARRGLPPRPGRLAWDGQGWTLRPDGPALAAVVVALDLDRWLLLRLQPHRGRLLWRVASARAAGPQWHGLRIALNMHATRPLDGSAHAG